MSRRQTDGDPGQVGDYRHEDATRRNNPPAGIAPAFELRERRVTPYAYDPHLDPQLQWAGKAEHTSFEVDVVSLHIHERVSARAILDAVRRPEPLQLSLFGETPLPLDQQIEFYQHDIDWANRLILGDSLLVMNSLLVKEGMAGKVQMIYFDPPYGIRYSSNFQPRLDRRDVKDHDEDLTREPEQIKAYRDTWKLGTHSYLTYLRDRLFLARELLSETGSIFVQINDENLHLVRCLLDEVFGRENFCQIVVVTKTSPPTDLLLPGVSDYLLWYAKNKAHATYRQLYLPKQLGGPGSSQYTTIEFPDGTGRKLSRQERESPVGLAEGIRAFAASDLTSSHEYSLGKEAFEFRGRLFSPGRRYWSTTPAGMCRLKDADRLLTIGNTLFYKRYLDDFPVFPLSNVWGDTSSSFAERLYSVQTITKIVERCVLMTTEPGDLVFDPTCVRKGTRVWAPSLTLPVDGEGTDSWDEIENEVVLACYQDGDRTDDASPSSLPRSRGRLGGGPTRSPAMPGQLIPIEHIQPGQHILSHDGKLNRVLRVIRKRYRGPLVGLRHALCPETLWLTADHRVLAKRRPRSLGGNRDWSGSPLTLFERRRELRRQMTDTERMLWSGLRCHQSGYKFRRQHPIGPYIADFYCREAHLVVEIDGDQHFTPQGQEHDAQRDQHMRALGVDVLRFTTAEVRHNLEGVLLAIDNQCRLRTESLEGAEWVQAGHLLPGDIVFFGPSLQAVPLESVEVELSDEEVYDLEVERAHSFVTEVAAIHNCGSGTTAYCAEKWGRRWITCDTSRVALAIARQRLMTARYDYYQLADAERGPAGGFIYEAVPHITLESIAKNAEVDQIAAKYQPQIDEALAELNSALGRQWKEWEVPRELPSQPAAPEGAARVVHERFWALKNKKRQEIDASIQRNAPQETLYDRPKVRRGVVRVSGPFTVEAIPVPAVEDPTQVGAFRETPIPQFEEDEARACPEWDERARVSDRGGDYLTTMLNLLKQQGGLLFPGGKRMEIENIRLLNLGMLHAEAEARQNGKALRVAISFGPQYGPVTATQVAEAIPTAHNNAYDALIFAGFSFDPEAQAFVQRAPVRGLEVHFANIAPDVLVGDLLKTTRASQVFTVFGQPDVALQERKDGAYVVELRGVDVYDPLTGETLHTRGADVAAWFLDTDYDGLTFHICQAFFPGDEDAWEKLQRALKAQIAAEAFEQMRGTVSFPFKLGQHRRVAVKVVDFHGNETVRVLRSAFSDLSR